jgi:saccharopine dehydrogenase (NAD+, L-lysine-forming)
MRHRIGIRREDKNRWERRAALSPDDVRTLVDETGLEVWVQPSDIRVFPDAEYAAAGATISESLDDCPVVLGVKEMPPSFFAEGRTYAFFSHTHKGQVQNLPMLRALIDRRCQLLDYELIVDDRGRRLVFFGRFAGLAGMIDALWALGKRFQWEGFETPLSTVRMAHEYPDLSAAKAHVSEVGREIARFGLPSGVRPLVVGVAGYGHVSQGAQEILDLLPVREVSPDDLGAASKSSLACAREIVKVVFKEEHTVVRRDGSATFDLAEFYRKPERYAAGFDRYLPYVTMLVNAVYWDYRYPRLVTKQAVRELYSRRAAPALRVIADISCDVEGSVECTLQTTTPDNPVFVYHPESDTPVDGWEGRGPVILAVDNLPCELAREATTYFGHVLRQYIVPLAGTDYTAGFDGCGLPPELKSAMILYHGELTPAYEYMRRFMA